MIRKNSARFFNRRSKNDSFLFQAHNKAYPEEIKNFMHIVEKHALQQLSESFLSPPPWTKYVRNEILVFQDPSGIYHMREKMT